MYHRAPLSQGVEDKARRRRRWDPGASNPSRTYAESSTHFRSPTKTHAQVDVVLRKVLSPLVAPSPRSTLRARAMGRRLNEKAPPCGGALKFIYPGNAL